MAAAGLASRRQAEAWIKDGRVQLGREVATLGAVAAAGDTLTVNGQHFRVQVDIQGDTAMLLYNKPEGLVTTRHDPEGRATIFDRLPRPDKGRWVSIGRLDINTTGLLLLTNDGELANALTHPSNQVDREYACRIHGEVSDAMLQRLRDGVELDDGPARFSDIKRAGGERSNQWFHVVLMEGRNREVRRLWESQKVRVSRLKRVRYGGVFLPSRLKVGRYEFLSDSDIATLRKDIGLPAQHARLVLKAGSTRARPATRKRPGSGRRPVRR